MRLSPSDFEIFVNKGALPGHFGGVQELRHSTSPLAQAAISYHIHIPMASVAVAYSIAVLSPFQPPAPSATVAPLARFICSFGETA